MSKTARLVWFAVGMTVFSGSASASLVFGGIEDTPGSTVSENLGDFNDLIFRLSGNLSVVTAGNFLPFNAAVVNESGTVFWDQPSADGLLYNFGFCMLGNGNCEVAGLSTPPTTYLATAGGAAPNSVLFQANGSLTMDLLFEKTALILLNTLGWYDPAHPNDLHPLYIGTDSAGASVTFTPSSVFALYSTNGLGQVYSTLAASNVAESGSQQHFAFMYTDGDVDVTPEPGTASMMAVAGIVLLAAGLRRRFIRR